MLWIGASEGTVKVGWAEGFEPSATGTTIRRSTKLSYAHREYQLQLTKNHPRTPYWIKYCANFPSASVNVDSASDFAANAIRKWRYVMPPRSSTPVCSKLFGTPRGFRLAAASRSTWPVKNAFASPLK